MRVHVDYGDGRTALISRHGLADIIRKEGWEPQYVADFLTNGIIRFGLVLYKLEA